MVPNNEFIQGDRILWIERPGNGPNLMKSGKVITTFGDIVFFKGDTTNGPQQLPKRLVIRRF